MAPLYTRTKQTKIISTQTARDRSLNFWLRFNSLSYGHLQGLGILFIYLFPFFVNKTASIHNKKHNIYQREKMAKPKGLEQAADGNLETH